MKKLFLSVLVVGALASSLYFGLTSAYFTDSETSSDNFIQAGTVDIDVDGYNPWEEAAPWVVEDIKPSTTHYMSFTVNNVGENMVDVWKKLVDLEYADGLHPESENEEDSSGDINDIGGVIHYDMYVDGQPLIEESDGYTVDEGSHQLDNYPGVAGYWMYLGRVAPNESMEVEQSYHMNSETTNWAQGDNMTFTVELLAQQVLGGAPAPDGELEGYGRDDRVGEEGLDLLDVGDGTSEASHSLLGWSNDQDGVSYSGSNYGGGDSGQPYGGTFRLLMGPGDGCDEGNVTASFTLDAGSDYATGVTLRHLDGSQDDSYDVYVNGTKIGHYEWDGITGESWATTTFNFSAPQTGVVTVELVATDPATQWCQTYGQVAFSWARLEY